MGYRVLRYGLTSGIHNSHPDANRIVATIISGGGGGQGSRYPMIFNAEDIHEAWAMYGQKGGAACWDTLEPRSCVAEDGQNFSWPAHGLVADQPVFVQGLPSAVLYVHGPSKTPDSFGLCIYPHTAPDVVTPFYPGNTPNNWGQSIGLDITPYRYAALGGNPGGGIGDQAIPGSVIGDFSRGKYWYGGVGRVALGCGGAGGSVDGSGAGVQQVGGGDGNPGINLQGEGGSGAGFVRPDGGYPIYDQFGPGGGAGGSKWVIECELKPQYYFHAGIAAQGGNAGVYGFKGGAGSMPLVQVEEWFPDEVEE